MADYVDRFLSQERKAMQVFGEQDNARAFTAGGRGVPFTPFEYARGISAWYYQNLPTLVSQLEKSSNSGRNVAAKVLSPLLGGAIAIDGGTQIVGSVFPSSAMVQLGAEASDPDSFGGIFKDLKAKIIPRTAENLGIRDAMRTMGNASAGALVALETASVTINEAGKSCLDPASAAKFWESWGKYAGGANLAGLTPDQPSFWAGIKDEIDELPQEFKDAAEAAGGLAADALVFAGETAGRTAKGFLGSLGIVNGILAGGALWVGWKVGWI
jgi:hypothetical protein